MAQTIEHALTALAVDPMDHRAQRNAVRVILPSVVSNLRSRVSYEIASEIANDTANAILHRALNGAEVSVGLVFGIARNLYRKHVELVTAQKRQVQPGLDTLHTDAPIEHHEVRDAVSQLPADIGKVIVERYFNDKTRSAVAMTSGLSVKQVRNLESRGLDHLRETLMA